MLTVAAMPASPSLPLQPVRLTLRDGRHVLVREISEHDKAGLLAAFSRLSADARYTRFMAPMKDLPEAMLETATHPVAGRECALVAIGIDEGQPEREPIVGGARFVSAPGSDVCEFAVTLDDGWHGAGLARRLMTMLIDIAKERGYRRMEGFVLAMNSSMRGLAHRLGFADVACPDDATVRIVSLALHEDDPGQERPVESGDTA